ncbi:MAG: 16S rRNA (uracil(1498)-N(3))-methyltransferase [Thermoanaerobaculia bacterium]
MLDALVYRFVVKNRFHVPELPPPGESVELTGDEFHHAVRVHRSREGEEVELFDGRGGCAEGVIREVGKSSARVEILAPLGISRESALELTLAMALIQMERFELVLQKATELGVRRIIPMTTERTEIRAGRAAGRHGRWEKIVMEAVKQCGRSMVPAVEEITSFDAVLALAIPKVLFESDLPPGVLGVSSGELAAMVGPEGGWSPDELQRALDRGCIPRSLGPRRLRAETAAIAGLSLLQSSLGDLG